VLAQQPPRVPRERAPWPAGVAVRHQLDHDPLARDRRTRQRHPPAVARAPAQADRLCAVAAATWERRAGRAGPGPDPSTTRVGERPAGRFTPPPTYSYDYDPQLYSY
jgi:hypothetical protein